jgi:phosphatidylglycerophosphatase B
VAHAALAVSDSASARGMPFVVAALTTLVITRTGIQIRQRARELAAISLALVVFLGAGSALNESVIKPAFASPRPDIVELSARGVLPVSPARFYELPSKRARREYLAEVLRAPRASAIGLSPAVRRHWLDETGFSFPSGHSTAAMMVATFFLLLGSVTLRGARLIPLAPLLAWAVCVCVSRPVLRVHRPVDITVGAVQGALLGALAFWLVRALARPEREPRASVPPGSAE